MRYVFKEMTRKFDALSEVPKTKWCIWATGRKTILDKRCLHFVHFLGGIVRLWRCAHSGGQSLLTCEKTI